jgi:hypothetical protein
VTRLEFAMHNVRGKSPHSEQPNPSIWIWTSDQDVEASKAILRR